MLKKTWQPDFEFLSKAWDMVKILPKFYSWSIDDISSSFFDSSHNIKARELILCINTALTNTWSLLLMHFTLKLSTKPAGEFSKTPSWKKWKTFFWLRGLSADNWSWNPAREGLTFSPTAKNAYLLNLNYDGFKMFKNSFIKLFEEFYLRRQSLWVVTSILLLTDRLEVKTKYLPHYSN